MSDTAGLEALVAQQRTALIDLRRRVDEAIGAIDRKQDPLTVTPFGAAVLACENAAELRSLLDQAGSP